MAKVPEACEVERRRRWVLALMMRVSVEEVESEGAGGGSTPVMDVGLLVLMAGSTPEEEEGKEDGGGIDTDEESAARM